MRFIGGVISNSDKREPRFGRCFPCRVPLVGLCLVMHPEIGFLSCRFFGKFFCFDVGFLKSGIVFIPNGRGANLFFTYFRIFIRHGDKCQTFFLSGHRLALLPFQWHVFSFFICCRHLILGFTLTFCFCISFVLDLTLLIYSHFRCSRTRKQFF